VRKKEHDDFNEVRTTADHFHLWLTLSRLVAVSDAELTLSNSLFEKARSLEVNRAARLPATVPVKKQ
jgi:hypothetical protein